MDKEEILLLAQDVYNFKEALRNLTNTCVMHQGKDKKTVQSFVHEHLRGAIQILKKLLKKYPELQSTEMLLKAQNLIHYVQSVGTKVPDDSLNFNDFVNQLATSFSIRVSAYLMCEPELEIIGGGIEQSAVKVGSGPVFGAPLEEQCGGRAGRRVPAAVTSCIRAVERHGIHVKGIYRVSSVRSRVEPLCRALEAAADGRPLALDDAALMREPHVVANALKLYLRRLPQPLLTSNLYPHFIQLAKEQLSDEERRHRLRELVLRLPAAHHATASALVCHLARVAAADNNMSAANLGIVFGPTLLGGPPLDAVHQTRLVRLLIADVHHVFPAEDDDGYVDCYVDGDQTINTNCVD